MYRLFALSPVTPRDVQFRAQTRVRLPFASPLRSGAFFYYNTGVYANYLDALMAIYNEAQAKGIPYKGVLLDVSQSAAREAGAGAAAADDDDEQLRATAVWGRGALECRNVARLSPLRVGECPRLSASTPLLLSLRWEFSNNGLRHAPPLKDLAIVSVLRRCAPAPPAYLSAGSRPLFLSFARGVPAVVVVLQGRHGRREELDRGAFCCSF